MKRQKTIAVKFRSRPLSVFRRGVRIEADGFNQAALFSELHDRKTAVRDIDRISASKCRFTVSEKDAKNAFAILEKLCYNSKVVESAGYKSFARYLLQKAALLTALAVLTAALLFGSNYVWRIEVTGCERTESAAIERFLKENGIGPGMSKNRFDQTLTRSLLNGYPEILVSSVTLSGVSLKVEVTETTQTAPPPESSDLGIYSLFDATVTRVITSSGTPLVKPGSRIFQGAKLIGAYRIDAQGNEIPQAAKGVVYGQVTWSDSVDFSLIETVRTRTGKSEKKTDLSFFAFSTKAKDKHRFASSETETTFSYAFENFFIPLKVKRTVTYEVTETKAHFDLDERVKFHTDSVLLKRAIEAGSAKVNVTNLLKPIAENAYRLYIFTQAEIIIGQI